MPVTGGYKQMPRETAAAPTPSIPWAQKKNQTENIKALLLAAGLGSRMLPLTDHHIPKPMFPLGGKIPMIESWIQKFTASGIKTTAMNLCVLNQTLKDYFKDGAKYGMKIEYVEEDFPSGTFGGACKQTLGHSAKKTYAEEKMTAISPFHGSTVFIISGDIVSNFGVDELERLYEIHKQKGAAFTMVLTPVPWEHRGEFGTVQLDSPEILDQPFSKSGRIIDFREKDPNSPSNLNNSSIYIMETELLKLLDPFRTEAKVGIENPFYDFGKHVFPCMLNKLNYIPLPRDFVLWGIQYDELWFDVGRKRDYLDVNKSVLDGKLKIDMPFEKHPWGYMGTDVSIDFSRVKIIPPVSIGDNCVIGKNSVIGPYAVIGDDWNIGEGVQIKNSVLWPPYEYYHNNNNRIDPREWKSLDKHEVCPNVCIDTSIVVGGTIDENMVEKTVTVNSEGKTVIHSIDFVPKSPRA